METGYIFIVILGLGLITLASVVAYYEVKSNLEEK